jgi:hypothetical protein
MLLQTLRTACKCSRRWAAHASMSYSGWLGWRAFEGRRVGGRWFGGIGGVQHEKAKVRMAIIQPIAVLVIYDHPGRVGLTRWSG